LVCHLGIFARFPASHRFAQIPPSQRLARQYPLRHNSCSHRDTARKITIPIEEIDFMGAKQLVYSDEARQKLLTGVSKLARAVRCTLGPRGRNAILDKGWGSPNITKDGVTVAEEIELQDPYENMGAQLVKEAASKTSAVAGDGTTTATVIAEAIYREGLKMIAAGHDPMALTRGVQKAVDRIVAKLADMAEKIDPNDQKSITEVATIASNNN